jgi:hypothetical protein
VIETGSRQCRLCGQHFAETAESSGSAAGLRERNLNAVDLPVEANRQPPDIRRHCIAGHELPFRTGRSGACRCRRYRPECQRASRARAGLQFGRYLSSALGT